MLRKVKKNLLIALGFILVFIGALFVVLPGPAFLFLPFGLAILSLEYDWAKDWLRKVQRMMSVSARKLDSWIARWRFRR